MANLFEEFQANFQQGGHTTVIKTLGGTEISYRAILEQCGRYAGALKNLGLRGGDRIAVQVDKSPQNVALYLACLQKGIIYLPLNNAYKAHELEYFFNDSEPVVIVCRPEAEDTVCNLRYLYDKPSVLTLDRAGEGTLAVAVDTVVPDYDIVPCGDEAIAAILYTSGTTGRSKGAMLSHGNLLSNAKALHKLWGWRQGDVLLHALPVFHVHGLFVALHCAFLNASPILLLPSFDAEGVIRLLPQATVFMGVPTFYTRLLAEPGFTADTCRNIRLFVSGSAPLHPDTFTEFKSRTGHTILERYGMTEAGMITSNPLKDERRCGTVGFPLPGVQVRITNGEGQEVGPGATGKLEVKGPNVFAGYWRMPEKNREEFTEDGFFQTGDLATVDQDGYISIVGRSKDLIITGGYNVYPKEIELAIDELQSVRESAVFGVPHPDFGEAVVAAVVPEQDGEDQENLIISSLKDNMASYKVPKKILFISSLPRNTMGKVQKNILREENRDLFE